MTTTQENFRNPYIKVDILSPNVLDARGFCSIVAVFGCDSVPPTSFSVSEAVVESSVRVGDFAASNTAAFSNKVKLMIKSENASNPILDSSIVK